jgi:DNA-directed RNA polymerase subunit RPC12/RpoP
MTHWEFGHLPFDGELTDDKIVCQNCGWSWNVKDGGDDLYVCHKCGNDNSNFYLRNKEVYSNAVDPNLIVQGVSSLASLGGSIAQGKASKQMAKGDLQKEVEARCGKDKSKSWSKKKKTAFISCRDSVIEQIDTDKKLARSDKQKSEQLQQQQRQALIQANQQKQKNQTYIVIGVIALVLGFVIYKRMNK